MEKAQVSAAMPPTVGEPKGFGRLVGAILPAAVVVKVMVVVPLPVTAEPEHVTRSGRAEHVGVTVPVKPPSAATVNVTVPCAPGLATVTVGELKDSVKSPLAFVVEVHTAAFTKLAAFTDPRPVAKS
jgi:hypothetical protein